MISVNMSETESIGNETSVANPASCPEISTYFAHSQLSSQQTSHFKHIKAIAKSMIVICLHHVLPAMHHATGNLYSLVEWAEQTLYHVVICVSVLTCEDFRSPGDACKAWPGPLGFVGLLGLCPVAKSWNRTVGSVISPKWWYWTEASNVAGCRDGLV